MLNNLESFNDKNISLIVAGNRAKYIFFEMFSNCNYNCSYCFFKNKDTFLNKEINSDTVKRELLSRTEKIVAFAKKNKINNFCILGGEPSLLKEETLAEIIKKTIYKNSKIRLITNFSKKETYYIKLLKYINYNDFSLQLSFHEEFENLNIFLKKLKAVILCIKYLKLNNKIIINFVQTEQNLFLKKILIKEIKEIKEIYNNIHLELSSNVLSEKNSKINEKKSFYIYKNGQKKEKDFSRLLLNFKHSCKIKGISFKPNGDVVSSCVAEIPLIKNFFNKKINNIDLNKFYLCDCNNCSGCYMVIKNEE